MINEETFWLESIAHNLSWLPSLPVFWSFWNQMRKSSMAGNKHNLLHTAFRMFGPLETLRLTPCYAFMMDRKNISHALGLGFTAELTLASGLRHV